MNIDRTHIATLPVYNTLKPREGPVSIPLSIDFTATNVWVIDGQTLSSYISFIQTIFADATGSTVDLTILIRGSNQTILVKAGTQGYYPVVCPNPFVITFTCPGGPKNLQVILMNVLIPANLI